MLLKRAPKEIATHITRELEFQKTSLVFVTRGNDSLRNILNRAGAIIAPPDGDATFQANILRMCGVYLDR